MATSRPASGRDPRQDASQAHVEPEGTPGWVWGRLACLGKETIAHLGWDYPLVNHQKARADYLVDGYLDPAARARVEEIDPAIFARLDILDLQNELARLEFPRTPPLAMFLDSFAELTDQRFHRIGCGWSFCSHFSDLRGELLSQYEQTGLLPKNQIPCAITGMILMLRSIWPGVPLFYIHFPSELDERPAFRERAEIIAGALRRIQATVDGVFSITADSQIVAPDPQAPPELQGFPYHFHSDVSLDLAAKVAAIIERPS